MVLVHELRICHPYSVADFEKGLHFGNVKTAEQMQETGGKGSELLSSSPYYDDVYGEGVFNVSQTRPGERLPAWTSKLISPDQLVLDDKTWFLYPFVRTLLTCPALVKLKIESLTLSLDDAGTTENALRLSKEQLAARTVEHIDLGAEKVDPADYREDRDPALYKSTVTGKGPLTPGWKDREGPMMCTYKAIIAECSYFGVSAKLEQLLVSMVRKLTILAHRTVFTTLDEWYPLSLDEVLDRRDQAKRAQGCTVLEYRKEKIPEEGEEPSALSDAGPSARSSLDLEHHDDDDDDEDLFLDAEMDLVLELQEASAHGIGGADSIPLAPLRCPFCEAAAGTSSSSEPSCSAPSLFCSSCREFYCTPCFDRVHVTTRMKQHKTNALPQAAAPQPTTEAPNFRSQSVAGDVTVLIPQNTAPKRLFDATSARQATADILSPVKEMLTPVGDFVTGVLAWDQVKDPPLNIFTAQRKLPGGAKGDAPKWLRVLQGSTDGTESCQFVEIPAELAISHPASLAGAMVSIMIAFFRSGDPSTPAFSAEASSSFPLGTYMPDADRLAELFPSLVSSSSSSSSGVSSGSADASKGTGTVGSQKSPYGTGKDLDGAYRNLCELTTVPGPSSDANLEDQRLQAAILYRTLGEELLGMDPMVLRERNTEAVAFWINLHNALLMHAYMVYGAPRHSLYLPILLQKASYVVGDIRFSAAAIAQTVLWPGASAECGPVTLGLPPAALPLGARGKSTNPLVVGAAVREAEPFAIFALSSGTRSSPLVRPIRAEMLRSQLEDAGRNFLEATVRVGRVKIHVPMAYYLHRFDFGRSKDEQLQVLLQLLPPSMAKEALDRAGAQTTGVGDVLSGWNEIRKDLFSGKTPTMAVKVKLFEADPEDNRFRYLFPN